jgi:nucleoside phosphorylase
VNTKIRVLIVDDNKVKVDTFIKIIMSSGTEKENIDVAFYGLEAREKLRQTQYDLMILDLALPMRNGDAPSHSGGVDLLDELSERPGYYRPLHIVGVTALEELVESFEQNFSDRMLNLLYYDPSTERWQSQLKTLLQDLIVSRSKSQSIGYIKDICIVTALKDTELRAVTSLPYNFKQPRLLDDVTYYQEGEFSSNERKYSVIASSASRMGLVAASLHASKIIAAFRPRILVMTGICAGVSGRANIGDVVLASPAWEWQSGKLITDSGQVKFLSDPHQLEVKRSVVAHFDMLRGQPAVWAEIASGWPGPKPETALKGVVGPLASGSVVLADGEKVREIQDQNRKLVGLDMEIYGVYAAAQEYSESEAAPTVFALKGVSDLADEHKSDDFQAYAAYTSAQAMHRFFEKFLSQLISG